MMQRSEAKLSWYLISEKERKGSVRSLQDVQSLKNLKTRALRSNVWFRVLSRTERAIVDLTVKCVERVKSEILAKAISNIIDKVLEALENRFLSRADKAGRDIAEKLSKIAQEWGNQDAPNWERDGFFIRFLGITRMND